MIRTEASSSGAGTWCRCVAVCAILAAMTQSAVALDDARLRQFGDSVTQQVCADGGQWLKCYRVEPARCAAVADAFVRPCVTTVFGTVEKQLSYNDGVAAAKRLVGCFNSRFLDSYGFQKLHGEECSKPPRHLSAQ